MNTLKIWSLLRTLGCVIYSSGDYAGVHWASHTGHFEKSQNNWMNDGRMAAVDSLWDVGTTTGVVTKRAFEMSFLKIRCP